MRLHKFLATIFSISCALSAQGGQSLNHQQLARLAETHVASLLPETAGEKREIKATPLDPRIPLRPCDKALLASVKNLQPDNGIVHVQLQCPTNNGWRLFVPVRIRTLVPVIVAKMPLSAHTVLTPQLIERRYVDKKRYRNTPEADLAALLGAKTTRRIGPGQAITSDSICLVCKGESVTITAMASGLEVKAPGTALSNAVLGERVSVKNRQTGKVVDATVKTAGQVVIEL